MRLWSDVGRNEAIVKPRNSEQSSVPPNRQGTQGSPAGWEGLLTQGLDLTRVCERAWIVNHDDQPERQSWKQVCRWRCGEAAADVSRRAQATVEGQGVPTL